MTLRNTTTISKSFPSSLTVLEAFYVWLESALSGLPLRKNDSNRVILATAEAFSNALQHGNRALPQKRVRVQISLSSDKLTVKVGDEGEGSKPSAPKKSRLFDTSGRGWELMHKLADEVSAHRENGLFWVELQFKMPKDGEEPQARKKGQKNAGKVRSGSG